MTAEELEPFRDVLKLPQNLQQAIRILRAGLSGDHRATRTATMTTDVNNTYSSSYLRTHGLILIQQRQYTIHEVFTPPDNMNDIYDLLAPLSMAKRMKIFLSYEKTFCLQLAGDISACARKLPNYAPGPPSGNSNGKQTANFTQRFPDNFPPQTRTIL
jgi:hypothetical protein